MNRVYEQGPGFVRAVACPDCGHTKCGESCVCNCDAARAEDALARLRVEAGRLALESESWRLRWESASAECDRARACAPPWLADAAEALGEVRPCDGAPLALNWTQVIQGIRELREDRDTLLKISRIVNGALNGESPLDREQRATKALYLVAQELGRPQ